MDGKNNGNYRLSGWAVLVIADICAAYWLYRAGTLSAPLAAVAGAAAAVVLLAARGVARSRARRRRELLTRLDGDMHAVVRAQRPE